MDRLLCTSLYRALLKSLTRKAVSENRLRNYFLDFAQQVTIICDDTDALSVLRALNYTQVQFRSLLRRVSERDTPPPHYLSRFINQAIEFIRTETDLLYYRLEHPQHFISEPVPQSPLHWSKKYHAVDLSEILCSFDLMSPRPIILSDGREAPFYLVIQLFEQFLNVKLGNPGDIKRRVLERKKDRTKFTEVIFHTLNDDENE